jgi:mannosyltransferase
MHMHETAADNFLLLYPRISKIISALLLFFFALGIRVYDLADESLWMDELRQVSYYPHSFQQIIYDAASQSQPPLDYWIGHLVHYFAFSDFAVRLPSALFGAGSALMIVLIVSRISSWPVSLFFGLIMALLPFNLYYSQEARPYSIAVFLFLCVLWLLDKLLACRGKIFIKTVVLLLSSTVFLYSRTLFPLVIAVTLLLILAVWFGFLLKHQGAILKAQRKSILAACIALVCSIGLYIPCFKIVLSQSGRYVIENSMGFMIDKVTAAFLSFDFSQMWQAFVVQTEPITLPLLILTGCSYYFVWKSNPRDKNTIFQICTILLPAASILNLLVYQAKATLPFRPAYASYLVPLSLVLAAVSFQGLWDLTKATGYGKGKRAILLALAAVFLYQTGAAAIESKSIQRKPDWRGVSRHLSESFGPEHFLIFDSLSSYGKWEPTFYGFPRYYDGRSPLLSVARIPLVAKKMAQRSHQPVFILFHWLDYYLTSHSRYPILSVPESKMAKIDYDMLCHDPHLECTRFTGFTVVTVKETSGNLAKDTYTIVRSLCPQLPQDARLVELYLAAAGLGRFLGHQDWKDHLRQAESLAGAKNLGKIREIGQIIDEFSVSPPKGRPSKANF